MCYFFHMIIGLAQIAPRLGDLKHNYDLHFAEIENAAKEKADLLVFPELSLTGYTLKDLSEEVALNPLKDSRFQKLVAASRRLSLVVGFVEEKEKGLYHNSAAFLSGGRIRHIHRKVFLPTGGIFEEGKIFMPGRIFAPFATPFGRAGLLICRDFLHTSASYLLFAGGAEMVIVISAAPGRGLSELAGFVSSRLWQLMGEAVSLFSTCFVVYCNRVGFEDGLAFAGGSFIFGPSGELLVKAPELEARSFFQEIRPEDVRAARRKFPYKRDDKPEIILEALKRIVGNHED